MAGGEDRVVDREAEENLDGEFARSRGETGNEAL